MFRLDLLNDSGASIGAACATEPLHMATARILAVAAAERHGRDVLVVRAGADERAVLIVHPDGSYDPPPGAVGVCKRHDGFCFCAACRAGRRA